jgi:hypothetical protein
MLDYDVKHLYSVIDQDLEFFFSSLGNMLASEQSPVRPARAFRKAVTLWCGQDLLATCAQDGNILHQALTANAKMLGQFAAPDRRAMRAHPGDDSPPALSRSIHPTSHARRRLATNLHVCCLVSYLDQCQA